MLKDQAFLKEYRTGTHDFVKELYHKAFRESTDYWRAVGYFRSSALEAFGSTLQSFLKGGGKIRLITSVELTEADSNAIEEGMSKQEICEKRINYIIENEFNESVGNGVVKLAKLLEIGRLEIKIAVPCSGRGIYHEKVGLFFDENDDYIAFSGSANESNSAFEKNYECIEVYTSWDDPSRAGMKKEHFEKLWNAQQKGAFVFTFPDASKRHLIQKIKQHPAYSYNLDSLNSPNELEEYGTMKPPRLPQELKLRDYQEQAYESWRQHGYRGILSMATGSGKTITAFSSIAKLADTIGYLAVIVVVPYQHLLEQWATEAKAFDITFIKCYESSQEWFIHLSTAITKFQFRQKKFLFIIATNSTFGTKKFQSLVKEIDQLLLIVDEAHNFGSKNIQKMYLNNADYRLGLSATPERHMDEEGTMAIKEYLGDIIFEYTLADAIKSGKLTPYKYFPVIVHLTGTEQKDYIELSKKISSLASYKNSENNDYLNSLLIKRARIIASAENKTDALQKLITEKNLTYSTFNLFYCAAKIEQEEDGAMRMVDKVNQMLTNLGMQVRNFTAFDAASKVARETLINNLKDQTIDGLVAIKCLDEGVDIPAVRRAFILSSSANPKEFIQRRGRVLRRSEGKEFAEIYDFIVIPLEDKSGEYQHYNKKYLASELERYREFARLALNYPECELPLIPVIREYNLQDK